MRFHHAVVGLFVSSDQQFYIKSLLRAGWDATDGTRLVDKAAFVTIGETYGWIPKYLTERFHSEVTFLHVQAPPGTDSDLNANLKKRRSLNNSKLRV